MDEKGREVTYIFSRRLLGGAARAGHKAQGAAHPAGAAHDTEVSFQQNLEGSTRSYPP